MSKVRVGLILDSTIVSKQIYDLLILSKSSKYYEISHLILQKTDERYPGNFINKCWKYISKRGLKKFINNASFSILYKLESIVTKKIYLQFRTFFDLYDISNFDLEHVNVKPIFSSSVLVYRYNENDLAKIKSLNLNLLIRGGSGILRGKILNICENGVISFHHGDNDINRGGPPGFWEVFNRQKRTGFVIQKLTEELDGGDVIFKGYVPTSFYYTLNLAILYEKSNLFFHKTIEKLILKPLEIKIYPKKPYLYPLYTTPSLYRQIQYIFLTLKIISLKIFRKLTKKSYRWGVAYLFDDNWKDTRQWSKLKKIPNPPNRFLADPFIWEKDGVHYCFVEDYSYSKKKGCISVFKITKDDCVEVGVAIEEDFHLSYPFLLSNENELYMCPETHEAEDIRLYKCIEFPLKWELSTILMSKVSATDTNIFKKNGRWWLMTNICSSGLPDFNSELHIFSSNNLLSSDWKPNNKNPVLFDPLVGRNGGLIIENDNIYRVQQRQGFDFYGEALGVAKITLLNDDEYEEEKIFQVEPNFFDNIEGTHTLNYKSGLLVLDCVKVDKHEKKS